MNADTAVGILFYVGLILFFFAALPVDLPKRWIAFCSGIWFSAVLVWALEHVRVV